MTETWLLYSTFPSAEKAFFTSRYLLEKRLVACANVYKDITSLYHWQGNIQEENEAVVMAKTRKELVPKAIEVVKSLHSYELPCIIAYPIKEGFPPFLQWIAQETAEAARDGKKV